MERRGATSDSFNGRRRAHAFKAERQAKFSQNVRKTFLEEGRTRKDEERARMEAYRRLCEKEGITSKRLEEYDRTRQAASDGLEKTLEQIDYDQSLTNNEKKRRKFNAKRKYAATTVTELVDKQQKRINAVTKVEELAQKRQEEREAKQREREEREQAKRDRFEARRAKSALFARKTKRGQPVMASRVAALLQDITASQSAPQ